MVDKNYTAVRSGRKHYGHSNTCGPSQCTENAGASFLALSIFMSILPGIIPSIQGHLLNMAGVIQFLRHGVMSQSDSISSS